MKTIWTTALMSACLIAPVANAQNTSGQAPTLPLYNAQAWIFTPDIAADEVIHQLTDMTCPMSLPGGYTLHTVAQMAQGGQTARCTYRHERETQNEAEISYTSISLTWIAEPPTVEFTSERLLSISPGAQLPATSKVSEVRENDFGGTVIPTCHHLTQTYVSDGVPRHEKIESCQFGKWSYQINQTAPQADTSFDTIVDTLTARHAPMAQNLDACSVPNTQTPTAIDMDTADGNELMESVLGGKVITEAVLQGEAGLPGISPTFCLVNYLGTDPADLLIMRDKTSELTPLMVYPASLTGFMSPTPIMWVEKTVPLGVKGETETYALYSTFEDGVIRLHKLYAGSAPDDQTAALDILGILSGDTPMRAYLRRSEQGDWSYHFASN